MLPHVVVYPSPSMFRLALKVGVAIQTTLEDARTKTDLEIEVVADKDKHYVKLSRMTGSIENSDLFAKLVVHALKLCRSKWEESYAYEITLEKDRFAVDPELYDVLPAKLLEFIEIDDELLFLSAKGVALFSDTVLMYKFEMA